MCISSALSTAIDKDVEIALAAPLTGVQLIALDALTKSILKKFEDSSEAADKAAIDKFLLTNEKVGNYEPIPDSHDDASLHRDLRYLLWRVLDGSNVIEPKDICEGLSVGPGKSLGVDGQSLIEKLTSGRMTTTDIRLFQVFQAWNAPFRYMNECEEIRSHFFGPPCVVDHSTLSCVPKNREISRTICTEPLVNMLFQQGIKAYLERRLKSAFGIDLVNQQAKNRFLARKGSETGRFATIDLSSASDSISTKLVTHYLPQVMRDWLMWTRTSKTKLPNGNVVELNMVSSMGNAFTFPLQTLLFASIVLVAYRHLDIKPIYPRGRLVGNFAVNGDDIIVVTEAYPLVSKLLTQCGFDVNREKTFVEGPFRESCGGDYFLGSDVRGVYIKRLDSLQDVYSAINRLGRWSSQHRVVLRNTTQCLLGLIKNDKLRSLYVPPDEQDTAGIHVYRPRGQLVVHREHGASGYLYKAFRPHTVTISYRMDSYYDFALAAQILYGGAKRADVASDEVRVAVRPLGAVKYDLCSSYTPRWGYGEMTSRISDPTGPLRTGKYVELNLGER